MSASEAHAPVLSTHQDESTFTYAKVKKGEVSRKLPVLQGEEYLDVVKSYYSVNELAKFLAQKDDSGNRKYRRVTLQFPDSLICDSAAIVTELQKKLGLDVDATNPELKPEIEQASSVCCQNDGSLNNCSKSESNGSSRCTLRTTKNPDSAERQRLWILADTSYSSCCVDEVAAEHVKSDFVVHFGDACLNPVSSLPTAYVFGMPQIDTQLLVSAFKERYPLADYCNSVIVLMADAPHTHHLQGLKDELTEYKIVVADLVAGENMHFLGYTPTLDKVSLNTLNRVFVGVELGDDSVLAEYDLFHITTPDAPRLLQLSTKFQSVSTCRDGIVSQGPFSNLMRRYRYMHMARAAGTVGILVNTLSLSNTKTLIQKIGERIKAAGKRHYVFVVGKPNVAKLANFDAVDLWCVLGCDHQGIILDEYNEYFKPIVTPYELLLAIGDEFQWTGKWVTEFEKVLEDMRIEEEENKPEEKQETDAQESDEEPEFDPVTGRYVSSARPLRRLQHLQISHETEGNDQEEPQAGGALVKKLGGTVILRDTVSTAAVHLQNREWKGLGSDWTDQDSTEAALVEEGTSGIARGYQFDNEDAFKNQT